MGQYIAATIMFLMTIGFASLFWLPVIKVKQKNQLVKFYWVGFWAFLGGLTALSGAQAVLVILGQDVEQLGQAFLVGLSAAFTVFVMFAWARLSLLGLAKLGAKRR